MSLSISKISLRTRLLILTAFAVIALLIAVISAYRTAQTSAFYAERQAAENVNRVIREIERGQDDFAQGRFEKDRKILPHIREIMDKYQNVLIQRTAIALHGMENISAGFCTNAGKSEAAIFNQDLNDEEKDFVNGLCRQNIINNSFRQDFSNSTLFISTAKLNDEKDSVAGAFAVRRVPKNNLLADRFNLLTQIFLLFSVVGTAVLAFLTLRDFRLGMRKIETGLQTIPNDLSTRIETTKIAELEKISGEINRLAKNLETNLAKQKNLEKDLAQNEKLAALGRVASGVAHEIRNPLAAIKLKIQIAQRGAIDEKLDNTFYVVGEEIERLDCIVGRLLEFGKTRSINFAPLDLNKLLRERAAFFSDVAERKNVRIERENLDDPLKIEGDENRLTEVFDNLLQNALNAIESGGAISIKSGVSNNFAKIEIRDTGAGIGAEESEKIFEPFFTTRSDGTGLGLAITREIVEAHDGQIRFESLTGQGATFFIELPHCGGK